MTKEVPIFLWCWINISRCYFNSHLINHCNQMYFWSLLKMKSHTLTEWIRIFLWNKSFLDKLMIQLFFSYFQVSLRSSFSDIHHKFWFLPRALLINFSSFWYLHLEKLPRKAQSRSTSTVFCCAPKTSTSTSSKSQNHSEYHWVGCLCVEHIRQKTMLKVIDID